MLNPRTLLMAMVLGLCSCTMRPPFHETYCNPIDMDYSYMVYNSEQNLSYRSGADPAVVEFRGEYYMFVTRSHGYWHSKDLTNWEFVTPKSIWYPQGSNAPAAHNYKDSLLYVCGDPSGSMSILYSDDPAAGKWKAVPAILHDLQDPDLFIDDDGQAYMFWGSSNFYPIKGKKLDMKDRFLVQGETFDVFNTDADRHGWERFGENHSDTIIAAYIEGPWLTKHDGRYYMQYAAPGTEFNVYGDGVYVSDNAEGPYEYQPHNPVCYKPGGFMNGAGHGSTVTGPGGQYWHYATMSLSAVVNWERRICAYPTFFDGDGIMYCDNSYGDYPHYAPSEAGMRGEFTGWMLLSYGKPVSCSSFQEGGAAEAEGFAEWNRPKVSPDFKPGNVNDENCKTYWLAGTATDAEWVAIDLGDTCTVNAVQINFHDHYSGYYTRMDGLVHDFIIEGSLDGERWNTVTRSKGKDTPNAYLQFDKPKKVRHIRYRNISVPTPNLAISGFRVFGKGSGAAPSEVSGFEAERCQDRRDAVLRWNPVPGATGYNIRWGIAPDKLYSSWLIYADPTSEKDRGCTHTLRCLSTDQEYYFTIEAFNENGISAQVSSDEDMIDKVQERTTRYFTDFADPVSGMARERSNDRNGNIVTVGGSGFGLMALIAAQERGYISEEQACDQYGRILGFLENVERFHGAWAHWYDADTRETFSFSRFDDGGDIVETSFMAQGLITLRQYLKDSHPELSSRADQLWKDIDWEWYTRDHSDSLYWHWSKNHGWKMNHRITGYDECFITYVLAASSPTHPIRREVYESCYKNSDYYYNGKSYYGIPLTIGMDYGGPLFFTHYSFLGLDPRGLSDGLTDYFERGKAHSLIHYRYAIDNPKGHKGLGANLWGFTSSDDPVAGYCSHHPGTDDENGTVSPTAAISSIVYTPKESLECMRHLYHDLGEAMFGDMGFYDAYNPSMPQDKQVVRSYLAIDQGPIAVMLENYRSGLLWELFMSAPEVEEGLHRLGINRKQPHHYE